MTEVTHLIDGRDVPGTGEAIPILDPADGTRLGSLGEATPEQVERAVGAAARSFRQGDWAGSSMAERRSVLRRIAHSIRDDADSLSRLQVAEGGIPVSQVRGHVAAAAAWFDYYADFLTREGGDTFRHLADATTLVEREPIGVCALFSPWNVPLALSALKLAPALAAGNSIILKPSEATPIAVRRMVDIVNGAGLPDGVLNCVNGRGPVTGAALSQAGGVDLISFTGGHKGGVAVSEAASRRHARCILELGGKSATIVFDDCDLDAAVEGAVTSAYGNNGLACLAGSRILLQRGISEEFLSRFRAATRDMRIGNPKDPDVRMGPMISAAHKNHVLGFYRRAVEDEDDILFGGDLEGPGNFVEPGAIRVATKLSRVWRTEVFGPIAAVAVFDSEKEAIDLGNDTAFGLSGYLWTRNLELALRVARRLRTGTVVVNSPFMRELNAPFGGFGMSGIGREGGEYSWANFTEEKTIVINHGSGKSC